MERDFNMKVMGSVLVVVGVLALLCAGLNGDLRMTMLDMGSFHPTAAARHNVPLSPIAGGLVLVGGLGLLVVPRRQQD